MANPSLQIGNDNWAIKEDNLLGYSTAGTRFVPQPITMTRATLGTRVNPEGLVEYVALLGSELVTNGDFASDSDWTFLDDSWKIIDGKLILTDTSTTNVYQAIGLVQNKFYKIVFTIANTTLGGVRVRLGTGAITSKFTNGTHTIYLEQTTTNDAFRFYADSSGVFNGSIDNVSVKEATIDNLPRVDYTDGTSSLLVEPQRRNLLEYSESISNLSSNTNGTGTFTITDNYTDSPQGVQNASRVQMSIVDTDDTNNYRLINTGSVMTNGVTREISFYAKSLTGLNQDVLVYWSYDQQIVTLTNDWQRFEISGTSANSGAVFIGTRGGSGNYFSGGDANLDFALWGLQVEDDGSGGGSSYPTSYVKTSGGTVTRVQETYEKTGISDKINSDEGVLFVEMAALSDDGTLRCITLSDGGTTNRVFILYNTTSNSIRALVVSTSTSGGISFDEEHTVTSTLDFHKIAIKWKLNDFALWIDGDEVATDTSGAAPVGLDRIVFDVGNGTYDFYGKVKQLQVYKTALSDSELETLTTI